MAKPRGDLTDKQRAFVLEYIKDWNATRAAKDAGYSEKTARFIGYDNLTKPHIRAEVEKRLTEMTMSAAEVSKRLSDMASSSLMPFVRIDEDGFVYFNFADVESRKYFHLIKKIKSKRERRVEGDGDSKEEWEGEWVEVELYDAQAALQTLGKHYKLFTDQIDVTSGGEKIMPPIDQIEQRILAIMTKLQERKDAGQKPA